MGKWMYTGPGPARVYPDAPWPGLQVSPGDVHDWGEGGPPADGCWTEVTEPPAEAAPAAASGPAAAGPASADAPAAAAAPAKTEGSA